jgi:WD40-like Beta Propeller Repeat
MLKRLNITILFLLLSSALKLQAQFYYGMQMDFGKNRIQYQVFNWTYFDYERIRVYFYAGGNEIAKYVSVSANNQLPILEKRLEHQVDDKINVIVYNNQNDFKQSNIGLNNDESSNIGGTTKIIGDKIFVYFNGNHADLDKQIRAALAELMINQDLYSGNAREMVKNSTMLNLPEWFTKGLVQYLSEGWNSYYDNVLYDALKNDKISKFNKLTGKQAANAGHALWHYIVDVHGESQIPSLLYMTKINRSPDYAFLFVIGTSFDNLLFDFVDAQNRRIYMTKDSARTSPIKNNTVLKKYKSTKHYYQLRLSPDAKNVAYATDELSQMKVYVKNLEEKKPTRILKKGPKLERLADYNYPLIQWHPNNKTVMMVYELKDQMVIHTYDTETKEKHIRNMPGFEKVNSFSFSQDGKKLVVSGVKKGKGQSDIFVFTLNNSGLEQITNDIWDDNNPIFVKSSKYIVFESNRTNDTIKAKDDAAFFNKFNKNMDLYMAPYPFKTQVLVGITNSSEIDERVPQAYTSQFITYLSEKNGIYNRYLAEFDSAISFVDTTEHYRYFFKSKLVTNYDRNILDQNINFNATHVAEMFYYNGKDYMAVTPLGKLDVVNYSQPKDSWFKMTIKPTLLDPYFYNAKKYQPETNSPSINQTPTKKQDGIDFDNYTLSGEPKKTEGVGTNTAISLAADSLKRSKNAGLITFPIQKNYFTSFYSDYIVTQFDNAYLGTSYQRFAGGGSPVYLNPGLNFLTKIGISDLFEDHRIVGAFRFSGIADLFTSGGVDNEVLLSYEYRKKKIDHQVVLHRQSFVKIDDFNGTPARAHVHDIRYTAKLPINEVLGAKGSVLYRNDKFTYFSQGDVSLPKKPAYDNYVGLRAELVFDDTRNVMVNIMNGFRGKVWGEYWRKIKNERHDLITAGFDLRHYQRVHRQITWCNRLAGGTSWGTDRLLFYLGGVDNWFNAKFNNEINIVKPETYQFQTLATNMRGFSQNIRNGNNFVTYNSELRFPIVKYFVDRPMRSDFLNNLQLISFFDLGAAWYGLNPLSKENTENVNTYLQGSSLSPIIITVINDKNPLVAGAGWGIRSRLYGYFVRLDFGYGIDNFRSQKAVIGLSFATDF